MQNLNSIDEVIAALQIIIDDCKAENNTMGYFAALYQNVTLKVKESIENNQFVDGRKMEELDVIFVSRYIDAYHAWKNKQPVTESWQRAFDVATQYRPIVLQHLLLGMNAHINLDLGIATAAVSKNANIDFSKNDFNKINEIITSLVTEVQHDLANIWPTLLRILKATRNVDDFLVDYSMKLSRVGAWKFAVSLTNKTDAEINQLIKKRDEIIRLKSKIITNPGVIVNILFLIIRIGERGSVKDKINHLVI